MSQFANIRHLEKIFISILLGAVFVFILNHFLSNEFKKNFSLIQVSVAGEIKKPGKYLLLPGISSQDFLKSVQPFASANCSAIKLPKLLLEDLSIFIPKKESIEVLIRDGEEVICHTVPYGIKLYQLKKYIKSKQAALAKLKSSRKVKEGECIDLTNFEKIRLNEKNS